MVVLWPVPRKPSKDVFVCSLCGGVCENACVCFENICLPLDMKDTLSDFLYFE